LQKMKAAAVFLTSFFYEEEEKQDEFAWHWILLWSILKVWNQKMHTIES
jgi:hypothetical protein